MRAVLAQCLERFLLKPLYLRQGSGQLEARENGFRHLEE